ncbi:extracellular solute-binding protein [Nonomuraea aurantiaca]|uniref:extracellular solute-binding protein n=1 Tax=Nonomuraea aurantiaca TaxID=2878562 RepID=UPI001CD93767|nr:extracellular solute-binding protein [Nonomuraea aurantiaca]MCA2227185.1 extracellular solute-binding protein [Nonomuraea aurantiaca]
MDRRTPAMALAMTALIASMGAATPSPKKTPTPTPTPTPSATPTQGDGTLQILTYRGYAEYGGTSPRVNWVGDFEKTTGCRIARLDTVQTADDMKKYVDQRAYDVVSAGPVLAASMIEAKQVQPIEPAKVTGYDDLTKRFRDMTKVSGKVYGVPYLWGYHEFLYDSIRIKGGGLKQVFQSDRVSLQDGPLTIADAALTDDSVDDPFELTKSQLERAMALLGEHKGRTYWKNPLDLVKGFATGSLDYAQATPYYRLLLQKAGKPVKAVSARKMTGWLDSWMLGANIPNTDCAYRWLSWMAAAPAQRDAAAWVGLAPANLKACKGRAKQMCDAYGADKPKWLDRVAFAARPPGGCRGSEGECTDYGTWTEQWGTLVN